MTTTTPLRSVPPLAAHPAACPCPACAVEAALLLLGSGRTEMGARLLGPLPARLRASDAALLDLAAAHAEVDRLTVQADAQHVAAGILEREIAEDRAELRRLEDAIGTRRRELARLRREAREARPDPRSRPHERLAAALAAGSTTPERVAEILKVRPADVAAIAAGRVGLPTSSWRKALAEVGA